jgi:hypothetical protein
MKLKQWRSTPDELAAIRKAIYQVCQDARPSRTTNRHVFYRLESLRLVPKTDAADRTKQWEHPGQWTPSGSDLVERQINWMRDNRELPWAWIADTSRTRTATGRVGSSTDLANHLDSNDYYSLDPWPDQPRYVETWIGKQSIEYVVSDAADEWDIGITPTKGFSSKSQLRDAALEIRELAAGRPVVILWLDDCDPSADKAYRAVRRELRRHAPDVFGDSEVINPEDPDVIVSGNCTFIKVAVTEQMRDERAVTFDGVTYPLHTRPTKDSTHGTAEQFGESIEIDALPPTVVNGLLARAINEVIDHDAWAATAAREQLERQRWRAGNEHLRDWFDQQGWL